MTGRAMVLWMAAALGATTWAQNSVPRQSEPETTLRVTSNAVLVDVLVTDRSGKPVTGLKQDAFGITENGKPQTINFFEEHRATQPAPAVEMPKLPPNEFTNFSPFPEPPAVNVLLLDSLNTRMQSQSWVHAQALKFLKSAKPGQRTAIFTMGLGFHFIQGFSDDPAILVAALNNRKNNEVQSSPLLTGQYESNAQQNLIAMMKAPAPGGGPVPVSVASAEAIESLAKFFEENDVSRSFDRMFVTLENLQRMANFLNAFPGRKNVIWFAETIPGFLLSPASAQVEQNTRLEREIKRTMAMLAAARVALYPVDARGIQENALYQAETVLPHTSLPSDLVGSGGAFSSSLKREDQTRAVDQANMELAAESTGGRAFMNTNGLGQVIEQITTASADFYTLAYTPTDTKMDGRFRPIEVKVGGGNYHLSYRRGYFASEDGLPGGGMQMRQAQVRRLASENPGKVDPLLPFMDLGMPASQQIVYRERVNEAAADTATGEKNKVHYTVNFNIDLKQLDLKVDDGARHNGLLNLSLLVYDRYGNVVTREEHLVALNIKPEVYEAFQQKGVALHADVTVPKGNYWLRTGIFDQNSGNVGTLEIPLGAVKPATASAEKQADR